MSNYLNAWQSHFSRHHKYLLSVAFRMTGSLSEAEDLVQECFIECAETDPTTIENQRAWLTRICSNKALDHLKRAYKQREVYVGPWLPDAIPDAFQLWEEALAAASPEKQAIVADSLTTSFLLLVEKLTPEERVVYLLSEVFDYSFREIGGFLEKTEEACRKIAERARKAISSKRSKFTAGRSDAERIISEFFTVAKEGNKEKLISMLAEGSEFWSDGGGKVAAAREVLLETDKIAQFMKGLGLAFVRRAHEIKIESASVNRRPGIIISRQLPSGEWTFETLISFELQGERISRIYAQRNPDKLAALLSVVGL
jgi:RNA polymerase sigma-70 factor (ECF subfamily)